jgi:hypothetical protein
MGIIRQVVKAFVLAVLDAEHNFPLGRGIVFQLVGDRHTRRSLLFLQQFWEQALGGLLAPPLDEDIENEALLLPGINPEPTIFPGWRVPSFMPVRMRRWSHIGRSNRGAR